MGAKDIHKEVLPLYSEHCFWCQAVHNWVQHQCDSPKVNVLCAISSQNVHFILLCWRNNYWHDISDILQLWLMPQLKTFWPYSSRTEVPPTSTVRFISTWTQCYQNVGLGEHLKMTTHWCYAPRGPLELRIVIISLGICQRLGIGPTIATWPRWPTGVDYCSSDEYQCTHVDLLLAGI